MVVLLCEHFEQFAPYDVVANGCLDDQHCKHFVPCSRMFLDVWTTMNIWPALGPWSELRVRMRQDLRALSRLPQLHLLIVGPNQVQNLRTLGHGLLPSCCFGLLCT